MKQELEAVVAAAAQKLFGDPSLDGVKVELTRPDAQFGDFATNLALQLAPKVGKSPREVAEQLRQQLLAEDSQRPANERQLTEVSVAGPGFLNLRLSDAALLAALDSRPARPLDGQVIVTEYSDPNPFKVLHAGHFYTSVVGEAISNLLEAAGATVHRVNFGGDVGLHVGKTMWAILQDLGGEDPAKLADIPADQRSEWMAACYVKGTNAYEDDESAKAAIIEANKRVYQLVTDNDHDSAFAQIYWTCRQWSYDYFNDFYKRIGSRFEKYYPESQTAPVGLAAVKEQLARGVFKESNGAVVFEGEPYGLHTRVFINSEGLPTYEAKDVGLSLAKWQDYKFDESVIITGNDIIEYMKVVLKAIEQFKPELTQRTKHLTHGNVKLAGGVKMSSRKGNFLRAVDVLEAASKAAKAATGQAQTSTVLAAIKYSFLKNRIGADIIYVPEESVSVVGNSGPYLQYAHARARSILAKATGSNQDITQELQPDERQLVRKLGEFVEAVDKATTELMPHHVCIYLYELAQEFNRFYENNRVVDDPRQALRLGLVNHYADTLKQGLALLGITAPDRL